jgi:hypothetical protein
MSSKPDYQLEYVFTKKKFKTVVWWCIGLFIALRVARIILYLTFGVMWLSSIPAAFIFFFTGFVLGVLFVAIYLYRASVRIEDIEREKDRLSQK